MMSCLFLFLAFSLSISSFNVCNDITLLEPRTQNPYAAKPGTNLLRHTTHVVNCEQPITHVVDCEQNSQIVLDSLGLSYLRE